MAAIEENNVKSKRIENGDINGSEEKWRKRAKESEEAKAIGGVAAASK
jgi:hypothetical protein